MKITYYVKSIIRNLMRNKKKFNEFMNKTIEELKDEKRYGTAHVYQSTLNAFCEFCGCKIIYFHQLRCLSRRWVSNSFSLYSIP